MRVHEPRRWLGTLPAELAAQRNVLTKILDAVERDERWRWLELGCSVAYGRGDALSDLDLGLGVADNAWPDALDDLADLLSGLNPVVDLLHHRLPEVGGLPHQRIFVQYADGTQIDLVAVPATLPKGTHPDTVILYDPDTLRSERWSDSFGRADAVQVREWAFLGWTALADLSKYLRRGSLWEARERLEQARTQIWRLWAVTQHLPDPQYGLTAVFDHPAAGEPPMIAGTIAGPSATELHRAALAAADLLDGVSNLAAAAVGGDAPGAMGAYVTGLLQTAICRQT